MLTSFGARVRARLIDDWRHAWRWASVRISTLGAAVFTAVSAFPSIATEAWNALPASLRDRLPDHIASLIAAALFVAVILGRVHKKKDRTDG